MSERDPTEFRPGRESSPWTFVIIVLVLIAAGAGWWYWSQRQVEPPPPPPAASAPPSDNPPAPAPAAVASGPQNPVDALAAPDAALPALADADAQVGDALTDLLGKKSVASFLQLDGFVRRFVATVDNLPRAQAPARVWPLNPAPQRFTVQGEGDNQTISADNGSRYTPFVLFAESVDTARAVAVYARLYPLFQQAYEELGYPGRYFNDRLVAVLDHLLQAPEPSGPVRVTLTEVKGDQAPDRPWVRYEFADPQLQALSAGQKMMVRMGPVNERRMKTKLTELRRQIATGAMAKK
ncbi:hypothetical protein SRS16CHR_02036 [Variovorax sp. SRS16]|uniref:DUF3014 domain-containing protein n=1 Tax=Variovorax sp. SRS16 TaxID=282217 RepID=UPI0013195EE9|nr:DUF3014 domain-containing protein [Variovorax sp. SRS16]VTU17469.1 hypothetical protein SRS16CHR_02036 [Variovorax sp. SRS16]